MSTLERIVFTPASVSPAGETQHAETPHRYRLADRAGRLVQPARALLRRLGVDVVRASTAGAVRSQSARVRLLSHYRVDQVLDVGANAGQYGRELRSGGFAGSIVSFEPIREAFQRLESAARGDDSWTAFPTALSDESGATLINVSRNSFSSSLLDILPVTTRAAPDAEYVNREHVAVDTLDSFVATFERLGQRPFLKVDVQGAERKVLRGATKSLSKFVGLELELSLVNLYDGDMLMKEALNLTESLGFELVWLEPVFIDPVSGRMLQCDGIFFRPGPVG